MSEQKDVAAFYAQRGIGNRTGWGERPAIIVIDLTPGFTDPSLPLGGDLAGVIAQTKRVLAVAREHGLPVIFTSIAYRDPDAEGGHWVRKIPALRTLRMGTPVVEADSRLERRENEPLVFKQFTSVFAGTPLAAMLQYRGVDTLVVCGTSTSGCIRASVADGVQLGFRCIVPEEAVGDRAEAPHRANLFDIDQKYADVLPVDEALETLARIGRDWTPKPGP